MKTSVLKLTEAQVKDFKEVMGMDLTTDRFVSIDMEGPNNFWVKSREGKRFSSLSFQKVKLWLESGMFAEDFELTIWKKGRKPVTDTDDRRIRALLKNTEFELQHCHNATRTWHFTLNPFFLPTINNFAHFD